MSCKPKSNNSTHELVQSNYNERVGNIFTYISERKLTIDLNNCSTLIILQTNLCNSCSKETLNSILNDVKKVKDSVFFILASVNKEYNEEIGKSHLKTKIFIDSANLLQKFNLSFMRNLQIKVCKKEIKSWQFH